MRKALGREGRMAGTSLGKIVRGEQDDRPGLPDMGKVDRAAWGILAEGFQKQVKASDLTFDG